MIISSKYHDSKFKSIDMEGKSQRLELLAFATKYGLKRTQKCAQNHFETLLERFCWGLGSPEDFDIATVEELVEICRPMKLREHESQPPATKQRTKKPATAKQDHKEAIKCLFESCNCTDIWSLMSSCIEEDLSVLPLEEVNSGNMFSRIVYFALQRYHKAMSNKFKQNTEPLIGNHGYTLKIGTESLPNHAVRYPKGVVSNESIQSDICSALNHFSLRDTEPAKYTRSYELDEEKRVLLVTCEPAPSKKKKVSDEGNSRAETPHKLKLSKPDLTVVLGRGKEASEAECYGVLLSLASAKLDSMIQESTGRLILEDVSLDDWKVFYQCISHNGCILDAENSVALIPLFQQFEMESYLEVSVLSLYLSDNMCEGPCNAHECQMVPNLLRWAVQKGFSSLQRTVEREVKAMFDNDDCG